MLVFSLVEILSSVSYLSALWETQKEVFCISFVSVSSRKTMFVPEKLVPYRILIKSKPLFL